MAPGEFLQTVKRRLHLLLSTQDNNLHAVNNWVIKEAANIDALQEGGTFRYFFLSHRRQGFHLNVLN